MFYTSLHTELIRNYIFIHVHDIQLFTTFKLYKSGYKGAELSQTVLKTWGNMATPKTQQNSVHTSLNILIETCFTFSAKCALYYTNVVFWCTIFHLHFFKTKLLIQTNLSATLGDLWNLFENENSASSV